MRHGWKLGRTPRLLHAGYYRRNLRNADSAVIGSSRTPSPLETGFERLRTLRPRVDPRLNQFAKRCL